jgi:Zn-dependent protease with chaperone function
VLGWFRPIVLVTGQALTGLSPQQLQAIIVHELAHIRRHDAFVNLFQLVAEMLLFYHPAVWWVSHRIRIEREVCCDNEAIKVCAEPVNYARALTLMEEWRAAPVMMMGANGGSLSERVLRLLGMQGASARSHVVALGLSIACVAAALFAGNVVATAAQAAEELSPRLIVSSPVAAREVEAPAPVTPAPAAVPAAPATPVAPAAPVSLAALAKPVKEPQAPEQPTQSPAPPAAPAAPEASTVPGTFPAPKAPTADVPAAPEAPTAAEAPAAPEMAAKLDKSSKPSSSKPSYVARLDAIGLKNLTVDQLIAMKVHGITPEYVEGMYAMRFHPGADELIALKVQGVTPSYVDETRRVVADPTIDDVIAMKVQGITPRYIRDIQAAGLDVRTADDVIAVAVQGITPEFVKAAIDHGFQDLTVDKLMALRNADVI